MTGIYNRTSKNSNLILFFVIALLLHFVVLSIPVKQRIASRLGQAISVCVVPYKGPETLISPEEATRSVLKPPDHPERAAPPAPKASIETPLLPKTVFQRQTEKKKVVAKQPQNVIKTGPPEMPSESKPRHEGIATLNSSGLGPGTPESEIRKGHDAFESASIAQGSGDGAFDLGPTSEIGDQGAMTYAMPRYKENPPPQYPRMAKRRGYEGRTILAVEVFENGKVGDVAIAESSGFDILDKAALDSVKTWTFVPGTQNGKPVRQRVMVPIRFDLN